MVVHRSFAGGGLAFRVFVSAVSKELGEARLARPTVFMIDRLATLHAEAVTAPPHPAESPP
jgi:hypothetical protein